MSNRSNIEGFDLNKLNDFTKRIDWNTIPIRLMEKRLSLLIQEYNDLNIPVNGETIKIIATGLMSDDSLENFTASNGWLTNFKNRNRLSSRRISGECQSVDMEIVDQWRLKLDELTDGYPKKDWWNCDESALFFKQLPIYTVAKTNSQVHGIKIFKDRFSIHLCVSACGEKLQPLIINKVERPQGFKRINYDLTRLGVSYANNKKGWMTSEIFEKWSIDWDENLIKMDRKILLFLDNFSGHKVSSELTNIKLIFFPPATTSVLQPPDAGIINVLKFNYKSSLNRQLIDAIKENYPDNHSQVGGAKNILKEYDVLKAINQIVKSWDELSVQSIINCWLHTKVLSN